MKELSEHQKKTLVMLRSTDKSFIVGVDEVGLGAWAGPLVVTAAMFSSKVDWEQLFHGPIRDSKQLSHDRRLQMIEPICSHAVSMYTVSTPSEDIDSVGAKTALLQATERSVQRCMEGFDPNDCLLVLDGNPPKDITDSVTLRGGVFLPKADALVGAVAAASIFAKECRDRWMKSVACTTYPGYCFEKHVGYGTADHMKALHSLGVCPLHRRSYLPIREILHGNKERSPYRTVEGC
jgi:ribonuclease HII